jgi:hypothetical protein
LDFFENDWMSWRYVDGDNWPVKWQINIDTIPVMDPIAAGIHTAKRISEKYGRVSLMCSGGIDSQIMVLCFQAAQVEFDVVIVDYCGLNAHDISVAKELCARIGIEPHIVTFDAMSFLVSGQYLDYATTYDIQSPQFCVHLKWYELVHAQLCNPLVLGGNTFTTVHHPITKEWQFGYHHGYNQLSYQRSPVPVIGSFLSYTPELAFSLWRNMEPKMGSTEFFANRTIEFKCRLAMYSKCGFEIVEPDDKFTGFEKIKDIINEGQYPGFFEHQFRVPISNKPVDPAVPIVMPETMEMQVDHILKNQQDGHS